MGGGWLSDVGAIDFQTNQIYLSNGKVKPIEEYVAMGGSIACNLGDPDPVEWRETRSEQEASDQMNHTMGPPYRTAAIVKYEEKPLPKLGNGFLVTKGTRPKPPPKPHECKKPGWWKRAWNGIENGAVWICKCGKTFEFMEPHDVIGYWTEITSYRDKRLLDNGFPPWKNDK